MRWMCSTGFAECCNKSGNENGDREKLEIEKLYEEIPGGFHYKIR